MATGALFHRDRNPPEETPAPAAAHRRLQANPSGVTWRAVAFSLLLIPLNSYYLDYSESVFGLGGPTTLSLFYHSVVLLLLLICLNVLLRRTRPRWAFSQGEMLTVYILLNVASGLAAFDLMQALPPAMSYPFRFNTPEKGWDTLFLNRIPGWLTVRDRDVFRGYWDGSSRFFALHILAAWAVPVLMWTLFLTTLMFVMLCLVVLLRRQWTEHEKLSYPLTQLPLDITSEGTAFFRNRLLWLGMGISAGIDLLQGLHVFFPAIPGLPIKETNLAAYLPSRPWNAIGWCPLTFYPIGIGLGLLLPLDMLFSSWFFFWFWKAQAVGAAALGWDQSPRFPYVNEQSLGAYLGICLFALWTGRRPLTAALGRLFRRRGPEDDRGEPLSYRAAGVGAIAGLAVLFLFIRAMGMSWWLIPLFFGVYLALAVSITRIRAELGAPAHDLHMGGPDTILPQVFGAQNLGPQCLVALTMTFWFNRAYRSHPMPFMLEGYKMADCASIAFRRLFFAILLAVVVAVLSSFLAQLHLAYKFGTAARMGSMPMVLGGEPYARLDGWLRGTPSDPANARAALLVGAGGALLLNVLRMRLVWFPFHPVGYAVSSSWSMGMLWMPMFIAWAVKLLLLRYGGLRLYRAAMPLFLGLILGECVLGGFWTLLGLLLGVNTYAIWP
jgi:hypothetical protein